MSIIPRPGRIVNRPPAFLAGGLSFSGGYGILYDKGAADKRQAVCSSLRLIPEEGSSLAPSVLMKGGAATAKRILWMKQRAVAGAALWFLQAHVMRAAKIS